MPLVLVVAKQKLKKLKIKKRRAKRDRAPGLKRYTVNTMGRIWPRQQAVSIRCSGFGSE